jgi:hypothetical protein
MLCQLIGYYAGDTLGIDSQPWQWHRLSNRNVTVPIKLHALDLPWRFYYFAR